MEDVIKSFVTAWNLIVSLDKEIFGIIVLTVVVTTASTILASLLGVPLGIILGSKRFKWKSFILKIINTFMSIPPVVAGLLVFLMLSRKGPFGSLGLLFTPTAMVIAQFIIILPIIMGLTAASVQ